MSAQQRKVVRKAWATDRKRYPRFAFVLERSIWAVGVLRFGQWVDAIDNRLVRLAGRSVYQAMFMSVESFTGISIPKSVQIGPGLRIFHSGGIVVHEKARLGANCTLRHGITIGVRSSNGGVPVIGDNVDIGAGAMILGDLIIGDDCKIGAGALVQLSMAAGAVAYAPRAVVVENVPVSATASASVLTEASSGSQTRRLRSRSRKTSRTSASH